MYRVKLTAKAKKELKKLSKEDKLFLGEIIEDLKEDPLIGKALDRELNGRFSYRFGSYRIIYKVDQKDKIVDIIEADHRGRIYN